METGTVKQHSLYRDLSIQNGMDLITENSFCKALAVDEKNVDFTNR